MYLNNGNNDDAYTKAMDNVILSYFFIHLTQSLTHFSCVCALFIIVIFLYSAIYCVCSLSPHFTKHKYTYKYTCNNKVICRSWHTSNLDIIRLFSSRKENTNAPKRKFVSNTIEHHHFIGLCAIENNNFWVWTIHWNHRSHC